MKTRKDEKLGVLYYKSGWCKDQNIFFLDKDRELHFVFWVSEEDEITDNQRESYTYFIQQITTISQDSIKSLDSYIKTYKDDIIPYIDNKINWIKTVTPKTVLIKKDGSIGVLCDCDWDLEHGIAIVINKGEEVQVCDEDSFFI